MSPSSTCRVMELWGVLEGQLSTFNHRTGKCCIPSFCCFLQLFIYVGLARYIALQYWPVGRALISSPDWNVGGLVTPWYLRYQGVLLSSVFL